MALRANTVYSYYVTQKPEITIERLFLDVCDNAYNDEIDEDDDEHVKDLWDGVYYNLMVTERSIESLVDFYDYLNMFEYQSVSVETKESAKVSEPTSRCETALSSVDAAVEAKIAEYLQSEKGSKIIENVIASKLASLQLPDPTHSASASVTQGVPGDEEIVKWIKGVEQQLSQNLNITEIRSGLLEEMLSLFDKLRDWSFRQTIDEQRPEGWKDIDVANISKDYEARRKALLRAVGNDVKNGGNDHKYDLEELYSAVKKLRD